MPKWFLKKPSKKVEIQTRFGFKIFVDPTFDANIEHVIYERGVYELGTVSLLTHYLKKGDLFIDVGANIGFLSLVGAAQVGEEGEVIAFEPVPSTYHLLVENKQLNNFNQLHPQPFALGSVNEHRTIFQENQNRGGASIVNKHSAEGIQIEVVALDEMIFDQHVKMIKVDVEGFELEVLKGGEQLIRKDWPILIVEHSTERENVGKPTELMEWLSDLGNYEFYQLKRGKERKSGIIKINASMDNLPTHDNIICLPVRN
ncbi:MAG: FkbM family methyltransferase [Crocinitomicaceae bacterium]|nr:FkbM family methyltransferase [Crocinitomicaceae bacterium]